MNTLIYDLRPDGTKIPKWFISRINECENINGRLYANIRDYQSVFVGDYVDDLSGCTIPLSEMTTGRSCEEVGIDLLTLHQRIGEAINEIDYFIMLVADIVEIQTNSRFLFGD